MKTFQRLIGIMWLIIVIVGLGACGTDERGQEIADEEVVFKDSTNVDVEVVSDEDVNGDTQADEQYPAETVKIAVVTFDTAGSQFIQVQKYFQHLSETFNIEMMYSESISNAEEELAFIESAAAGCKAVVGYYNVANEESVQLTIDKGMYYFGKTEDDAVYEKFKDNDMYLGGYYYGNAEYNAGYEMGLGLVEKGARKLVYISGGRDFGVQMFVDRSQGFYDAIDTAKESGIEVEVVDDVSGWPGTDEFAAASASAIEKDLDGMAFSFGAGPLLQPIFTSGKGDSILLASSDSLEAYYIDFMAAGQVAVITSEIIDNFGLVVPMLLNTLDGNVDVVRDNGSAPRVPVNRWSIKDYDEFMYLSTIQSDGTWAINGNDVKTIIKVLNPDASYETFTNLYASTSMAEIKARRVEE